MLPKHKRALERLLQCDTLNNWEKGTLTDMYHRYSKSGRAMSFGQLHIIRDAVSRHLKGGRTRLPRLPRATKVGVAEMIDTKHGWRVHFAGQAVGPALAKKDAEVVIEWLDASWRRLRAAKPPKQFEPAAQEDPVEPDEAEPVEYPEEEPEQPQENEASKLFGDLDLKGIQE